MQNEKFVVGHLEKYILVKLEQGVKKAFQILCAGGTLYYLISICFFISRKRSIDWFFRLYFIILLKLGSKHMNRPSLIKLAKEVVINEVLIPAAKPVPVSDIIWPISLFFEGPTHNMGVPEHIYS